MDKLNELRDACARASTTWAAHNRLWLELTKALYTASTQEKPGLERAIQIAERNAREAQRRWKQLDRQWWREYERLYPGTAQTQTA